MFNTLYRCPRTIARHENGPLAELRRRYLEQSWLPSVSASYQGGGRIVYRATIMDGVG